MRDAILLAPPPAGVGPPLRRAIPAGVDELEELRVGDAVHVDLEGVHADTVRGELVVPAERTRGAIGAEGHHAGRNGDCRALRRLAAELVAKPSRRALPQRSVFLVMRQAVPHVEQRLLVHRLVFEGREDGLTSSHRTVLAAREIKRGPAERRDDGLVRAPAKGLHVVA